MRYCFQQTKSTGWPFYYSTPAGANFGFLPGAMVVSTPGMILESSFISPVSAIPVAPTIRKDFPETWIWDAITDRLV